MKENEEVTPAETTAPAEQSPELTIQDLQSIKAIIDVASQRGTFKPNEMMAVGTVYNKLEAFLTAATAQPAAE